MSCLKEAANHSMAVSELEETGEEQDQPGRSLDRHPMHALQLAAFTCFTTNKRRTKLREKQSKKRKEEERDQQKGTSGGSLFSQFKYLFLPVLPDPPTSLLKTIPPLGKMIEQGAQKQRT